VRIYDISDPAHAILVKTINAASLGISAFSPHNPVIVGNLLFVSWYQAGLQVFDLTNPADPVWIGAYDTYPLPGNTDLAGNWGVFPFLGLKQSVAG